MILRYHGVGNALACLLAYRRDTPHPPALVADKKTETHKTQERSCNCNCIVMMF
jgi:hypothetical protein